MIIKLMPSLPKITDDILDMFIHTDLLELDRDGVWQWTQLAVDFAACIDFVKISQK